MNLGFFIEWSLTTLVASGNNKCISPGTDQVVLMKCKKLDRRGVAALSQGGGARTSQQRAGARCLHFFCQVKQRFRQLALQTHPDKCQDRFSVFDPLTCGWPRFQACFIISMSPTRGFSRTCINDLASQFRTHPYKVCVVQEFALWVWMYASCTRMRADQSSRKCAQRTRWLFSTHGVLMWLGVSLILPSPFSAKSSNRNHESIVGRFPPETDDSCSGEFQFWVSKGSKAFFILVMFWRSFILQALEAAWSRWHWEPGEPRREFFNPMATSPCTFELRVTGQTWCFAKYNFRILMEMKNPTI